MPERLEPLARKLWEIADEGHDEHEWESSRDQFLEKARVILAVLDAVPTQDRKFPSVQRASWGTARGFVRFVNLRPDWKRGYWVCDTCGQKVIKSQFDEHAHHERGY